MSSSGISIWLRVIDVCAATGWRVTPHELRPDLYPNADDGLPRAEHPLAEDRSVDRRDEINGRRPL